MVLRCFFVGLFFAAFSRACRIARSPPPSALPIMKTGLCFSSSVCGYLWYASTLTFSGFLRRHLIL